MEMMQIKNEFPVAPFKPATLGGANLYFSKSPLQLGSLTNQEGICSSHLYGWIHHFSMIHNKTKIIIDEYISANS